MRRKPFEDNVSIVTGASAGIGRELALQLAGQGAHVVLASRDRAKLEEVAVLCRARGGKTLVVRTDVGQREHVQRLLNTTVEHFGRLDTLINNAGYGLTGEIIDEHSLDQIEALFRTNFFGSVYCTQLALPYLVETKGRLVAVSSVAGIVGAPGSAAYCATKFALRGFFDSLRMEVSVLGISVTMIYPGFVVTEFAARVKDRNGKQRGREALKFYKKGMMSAETCARRILKATAKRKRQLLLSVPTKLAPWANLLTPRLLDAVTKRYRAARITRIEKILAGEKGKRAD